MKRFKRGLISFGLALSLISCTTAKKNKTNPALAEMTGKKVALVSIEGEDTARRVVEVALINQLVQRGTFILVSKQDVEAARTAPQQDPRDWNGIAKRTGADYALRARVIQFQADQNEGYSSDTVYDSQLAEEQGTDGKTERVYKVKSLDGHVRVELQFIRLSDNDTRIGFANADEKVEADAQKTAIHLPPSLRFLEKLSNKAFKEFFDQYN